ncbi:M23 family metallopeptidase [Skermania piniformis]|nr:M23 family metallopeptidase [Skermania piniformis]
MIQHRTLGSFDYLPSSGAGSGFDFRTAEPSFSGFGGTVLDYPETDFGIDEGRNKSHRGLTEDIVAARQERYTAPAGAGSELPPAQPPHSRRKGGAHRLPAPPAALKGRAAVLAVAAGAAVAAGQSAIQHDDHAPAPAGSATALAGTVGLTAATAGLPTAPQVLDSAKAVQIGDYASLLDKGQRFAEERTAAETAKLRPLYVPFTHGTFTSNFGFRWGALHAGVDIAAPIGTPIFAVADGKVIDAGPASGFGMWVRLQHSDGTITVYGHVDTATVATGQTVMAGDQIATVGNRGFSTGPHCHFEVWLNGNDKVDPLPWLASRGISLGPEQD